MIKLNHPVFFFHGLHGTPQGIKSRFLSQEIEALQVPHLPKNLGKRLQIARGLIKEPSYIIGSSLGGLTAILLANEAPELTKGLVLVAPAVGFYDPAIGTKKELELLVDLAIPNSVPTQILAGSEDEVIPLTDIEALAKRSPHAELTVLKDDHGMNQNLMIISKKLKLLLEQK